MPEGDSLHRAARRLQVLVGDRVSAESPNPRGQVTGVAEQVDGRVLESVEAIGKNLILRFEGGVTVRSHLRMSGRWRVEARGDPVIGRPWLVLRGRSAQALLYGGRVLELNSRAVRRLGPDILAPEPDFERMLATLRRGDPARQGGDALLDHRLVSGIGTVWRAESLWAERVSPWRPLADVPDEELERVVRWAAREMRRSVETGRNQTRVTAKAGLPCPRCKTPIRSRGQGDDNRTAYWCPVCQPGPDPG
ncbi:MAG: DNA-formamidopyrimidine glycosylase family protein [Solirubrobacteraceae bacterium]